MTHRIDTPDADDAPPVGLATNDRGERVLEFNGLAALLAGLVLRPLFGALCLVGVYRRERLSPTREAWVPFWSKEGGDP